ncbi:MAG: PfkB family carbohydrate kinase [Myxococcota bacterium]
MTAKKYDVAGTGSMVVDSIHFTPRLVVKDEKALLRADADGAITQRLVGGVTLNQLGWARILGLEVAIFGKQADDDNGRFLRAGMERLGIEHHLDLSGSASSFAQVYVDPSGGRAIYMARGATGELRPEEIDQVHRRAIESARVVTTEVSQLPLAAVRRVLEIARESGARTVLDLDVPFADAVPGLGSAADLHAALAAADILKPSLSALEGLVEGGSPLELARALAQRFGAQAVAITLGESGSLVWADDKGLEVPAAKVDVVDTTGAGDAFLGGFLAGLRAGLGWDGAARLGNACGGACCEQIGAFPDSPEAARSRVLELFASLGGPQLELRQPDYPSPEPGSPELERFLAVAAREVERVSRSSDRLAIAEVARSILRAEEGGGRVHVTGVGKPEHVARYAAALLSSTGTPATFLHGTEATHGSLGQVRPGDVVIAISNSGSTSEILETARALRAYGAELVALVGSRDSPLARTAGLVLEARVLAEGGPLGVAPRASVLAEILVMAALSVELERRRGFTRKDFRARHPAGALGESGED